MITINKPNILWICTDQQRYDTLGCYGNSFVDTPNLDQLAKQGTLFENCYSQNPLCAPSRASFLTGRYPRTTGCRGNGQSIPADEMLVTRQLANAGYTCGLSGKLHLAACAPKVCKGVEQRIDDGYTEFHWSHAPRHPNEYNAYLNWLNEQGVEYSSRPFQGSKHVEVSMPAEYHQTTWCAEKAADFIEQHRDDDNPWLFSVNMFDPHHPFDPPAEYLQRYLDCLDDIPLPTYVAGELENKTIFQQQDHIGAYNTKDFYPFDQMNNEEHRLVRAAYWAMIDLIDQQVGKVINALKETGQLDNTIILFMSDHGEMLGDHGIYLKGPYFYDPAIKVPLIVSWPGRIQANMKSEALVELIDIAPTLLDAVGLEQHAGMQGRSFWPLLTNQTNSDTHREDVYSEFYHSSVHHQDPLAQATMVSDGSYKLVSIHSANQGELYDLTKDPLELINLWNDKNYQTVKLEMFQRLANRMAQTIDPLPIREANF